MLDLHTMTASFITVRQDAMELSALAGQVVLLGDFCSIPSGTTPKHLIFDRA